MEKKLSVGLTRKQFEAFLLIIRLLGEGVCSRQPCLCLGWVMHTNEIIMPLPTIFKEGHCFLWAYLLYVFQFYQNKD